MRSGRDEGRSATTTTMLSRPLTALEKAFDILNAAFFESVLSKSVITISPTPCSYGHFTPWESWKGKDGKGHYEINLGAQDMDRPIENIIATLVHEMVHQWCHQKGIKDTSRGNTYHNKNFKVEAEKRGLVIDYDEKIGYSLTTPGPPILDMVKAGKFDACMDELCREKGRTRDGGTSGKKQSSTRKYVCPSCGMSIRATKEVRVQCMDCEEQMEVE